MPLAWRLSRSDRNSVRIASSKQVRIQMIGDNRDNSADSRVPSAVGYVPFENLVGKARIIFFSIGDGEPAWHIWSWPRSVRWSRLFTIVR
jgi:signal peptidase I